MSFNTLEANATIFRQVDEQEFGVSEFATDELLLAIKYDLAKEMFKNDCYEIFKLWNITSATSDLNSLVSDYEANFKSALMYLQIHLYYQSKAGSSGDATNERAGYYYKRYQNETSKFYNFEKPGNVKVTPVKIYKV